MYCTRDDEFQNMFAYQPTFRTTKYKNTNTEYVNNWRSKGVYNLTILLQLLIKTITEQQHLMEKVHGVLMMTSLEIYNILGR